MSSKRCTFVFLAALVMLAGAQCAWAGSGSWLGAGINNNWTNTDNWDYVPNGAGQIATLSNQGGLQVSTVNVDGAVTTVGEMDFGDTPVAPILVPGGFDWTIGGNAITLDNTGGVGGPVIRVSGLAAGKSAIINADLVGTTGLNVNPDLVVGTVTTQYAGRLVLAGNNTLLTNNSPAVTISRGTLNIANVNSIPGGAGAGTILINQCGALEAAGAYNTVANWLPSIDATSAGAIGLLAANSPDAQPINMAGYASLNLGAIGNVTYSGTLTPAGLNYNLGGGTGTLSLVNNGATPALSDNGGATSVTINGIVDLTGATNNTTGGVIVNPGDQRGKVTIANYGNLGLNPATQTIPNNGGTIAITNANPLGGIPNLDTNANWLTWNGGISNLDTAHTFSINTPVLGSNLTRAGDGQVDFNSSITLTGSLTINQADPPITNFNNPSITVGQLAINAGTVNLVDGANVTASLLRGEAIAMGTGGIDTAADNIITVNIGARGGAGALLFANDMSGISIGAGWGSGTGRNLVTVNVNGASTFKTSALGTAWPDNDYIVIGAWGRGEGTVNVYDTAKFESKGIWGLQLARWDATSGTLNLYNSSSVEVSAITDGGGANLGTRTGTINIYDNARVKAVGWSGDYTVSGMIALVKDGGGCNGVINIGTAGSGTPRLDCGELTLGYDDWWGAGTCTVKAAGNAIVVSHAGAEVGTDWSGTTATGNINVGLGHGTIGALTVSGNASVTAQGTINVDYLGTLNQDGPTSIISSGDAFVHNAGIANYTGGTPVPNITGTGTLNIGTIIVDPTVVLSTVRQGTVTVAPGSTLAIAANLSGPMAGLSMSAVPEPSTIVMLIIAAMGLALAAWRRK